VKPMGMQFGNDQSVISAEMPPSGEDHSNVVVVRCPYHLIVADGSARLDDGGGTGMHRFQEAIGKGEKRIGSHRRSMEVDPCVPALSAAIRAESTRDIWPAPTPSVRSAPRRRWHWT